MEYVPSPGIVPLIEDLHDARFGSSRNGLTTGKLELRRSPQRHPHAESRTRGAILESD